MHHTIFDTPAVNPLLRAGSVAFLRLTGWRVEGALPAGVAKCVLIAAPHTSNWDLPYTLMVAFQLRLHIYWTGKASIFRWPFRGLMMWLGGIPVQRETSNDLAALSIAAIKAADGRLQLAVPPEGTRSKTRYWKTGFYYIAKTEILAIANLWVKACQKCEFISGRAIACTLHRAAKNGWFSKNGWFYWRAVTRPARTKTSRPR